MSADPVTRLEELARELEWPATPDLAPAVLSRARAPRRARRWPIAVALAVLALAGATAAFPSARDDVLEWIGLRSVEVRREPQLPPAARAPGPADTGPPVALAEAARRA